MSLNKIKILPQNIANKIAAGEVIQRPESAVKELIENSIDAGAKNIELIVKGGGKTLIQVVDDGVGMSEEDAQLCLLRHATSKVYAYEDLECIKSYGFRGEAIASIAAVSQIEVQTRMAEEELGVLLKADGGEIQRIEKGSFPIGTNIVVKNLFYNTPARRNFLKSDSTELKHIIETFKRAALSRPELAFKFWNNDSLAFDFPSGTLEDRICRVFADNMLELLIEAKETTDYISMKGYIAKPNFLKRSKSEQYLFINKRYVVSRTINHAIFSAYNEFLEKGEYPFFILYLDIDPSKIDINVHPSKLEIKFENEKDVYSFVLAIIKKTLGEYDLTPSVSFSGGDSSLEELKFNPFVKTEKDDFTDRPPSANERAYNERKIENVNKRYTDEEIHLLFKSIDEEISGVIGGETPAGPFDSNRYEEIYHRSIEVEESKPDSSEGPFLVQLHNKYIMAQIKSGLMIIDQHVAHERILYEKALKIYEADFPFSQQLIFPPTITFDPAEFALLEELKPYLIKLGFSFKTFGKYTILLEGVPQDIKAGAEDAALKEILNEYVYNQREKRLEGVDNVAKSYACKAAIKAGDKLTINEMRILADNLFMTSNPYVCPHGRPIVIKLSLDELDKRFGRT